MKKLTATIILAFAVSGSPIAATLVPAEPLFPTQPPADPARDRAAILKMTGAFNVTFDFRETTPLVRGYAPLPAKVLGGHEVVRAIVDTPAHIVLQHLLVVEAEGKTIVVKHWRQDWDWQPATLLAYVGRGHWATRPVAAAERAGAWSQTVWQTDDSPRYGALGRWRYDDGVARWAGAETRRPLPRRDATRNPPYDHYVGTNRHVLTPTGWVQEEDNAKVGTRDGRPVTLVHETVVNTYAADPSFKAAAADSYWAKTGDYWESVRAAWSRAIARTGELRLGEDADAGSATGHELMLIADDIASGETPPAAAKAEAAALIDRATAR